MHNTKSVTIQSKRLVGEMRVFVWKNGKPQAQINYLTLLEGDIKDDEIIGLKSTSIKFKKKKLLKKHLV